MTAAEARVASALIVTLCGLASAAAAMVTAVVAAVVGVIVRVIADVVFSTIVRTGRIGVNALNAAGNTAGNKAWKTVGNTIGGNFHSPRFAGDLDGGIRLGFGGNFCRPDGFTGGRALAVPVAVTASGKGRQAIIHRRLQTA